MPPKSKKPDKPPITCAEAGARGGRTTSERYGHEHYEAIGKKGGRRVRDLIAAGKRALGEK